MRTRARKNSRDISEIAAAIVEAAISEKAVESEPDVSVAKNPHAQALSRLGARKGGLARSAKMTTEQRKESARRAAAARWRKPAKQD